MCRCVRLVEPVDAAKCGGFHPSSIPLRCSSSKVGLHLLIDASSKNCLFSEVRKPRECLRCQCSSCTFPNEEQIGGTLDTLGGAHLLLLCYSSVAHSLLIFCLFASHAQGEVESTRIKVEPSAIKVESSAIKEGGGRVLGSSRTTHRHTNQRNERGEMAGKQDVNTSCRSPVEREVATGGREASIVVIARLKLPIVRLKLSSPIR